MPKAGSFKDRSNDGNLAMDITQFQWRGLDQAVKVFLYLVNMSADLWEAFELITGTS